MLQDVLDGIPDLDPEVAESAVLLASEPAENAVLHAGTEFEVGLEVDDSAVTVSVTDRGPGPLEAHLAEPRHRYGRAASHGRGLGLVARLSAAWGTRHDADGRHTVWFTLTSTPAVAAPAPEALPDQAPRRVSPEQARRLLHIPAGLVDRLQPIELVEELVRRLRDVLDVHAIAVVVDEGDGAGPTEVARAGPMGGSVILEVALPVTPPLRGSVRLLGPPSDREGGEDLVELVAYRVAMAIETRWLRAVDQRRRAWMAYLAEASELLGQSLSVELAVAVVPQVVVPRLGRWCAVHLFEGGHTAGSPHSPTPTRTSSPSCGRRWTPKPAPGHPRSYAPLLDQLARGQSRPPDPLAAPTDGLAVPLRCPRHHHRHDARRASPTDGRTPPRTSSSSPTSPGGLRSPCRTPRARPRTSPCRRRSSRRCCRGSCPWRPVSTSRPNTCPPAAVSDVGGDFYNILTVDAERFLISMPRTSAARARGPPPAPASSATSCACWSATATGSPTRCTCSTT